MKSIYIAAIAAAFALSAQAAVADDAHHPDAAEPAASSAVPPQQSIPQASMPGGMMQGMMSPDMMRMMMDMMASRAGPAGGQPAAMGPMMAPEHVEGRIAFLEAELGVTDAQRPLWEAFADALRQKSALAGDTMPGMQGAMMAGTDVAETTPVERIEREAAALTARLDSLREVSAALKPFYAALDEAQKQKANRLLAPAPMGMM